MPPKKKKVSFTSHAGTTNPKIIARLYASGKHATSFGGRSYVSRFFKNMKPADVEDILYANDAYTRHSPLKKPRVTNPTYIRTKRKNLQGDILEVTALGEFNNGVRYILVIVDAFTRRVWLEPLKTKGARDAKEAFKAIIKRMGEIAEGAILCYDKGTEVYNKLVLPYLEKQGIKLIYSSSMKCPHSERKIADVKNLLHQYITETENRKYIHRLTDFEKTLNARYSRSHKMSADQAELPVNRNLVIETLQRRYNEIERNATKKPKYKVGDLVRFSLERGLFHRGYDEHNRIAVARVRTVLTHLPIVTYELEEFDAEPIEGRFYQAELIPYKVASFKISKVHKSRLNPVTKRPEVYVSWLGYKKSADSWVDKTKITKEQYNEFKSRKK